MRIEHYIDLPTFKQVFLTEADRALVLTVDLNAPNPTAGTRVFTFGCEAKKQGTTTRLYQEAKEILKQYAQEIGTPIEWKLMTKNPAMRTWITLPSGGLRVVGEWDKIILTETETFVTKFVSSTTP